MSPSLVTIAAMALTDNQRAQIIEVFEKFVAQRAKNLSKLKLDDLKFNVVALRASAKMLDFTTAIDLLRYRVAQHVERGSVTAMGTALQRVAKIIAGSGSGVAGADIEVVKGGRRYFVQVKSGPDTANKDIAQNIATLLNSARARNPEAACVLGVCYARPDQISGIAKQELQSRGVALKVGREFWEFISGDPDCMAELLELARDAAERVSAETKFADDVEAKVQELATEFDAKYGSDLTDAAVWEKFLADNS